MNEIDELLTHYGRPVAGFLQEDRINEICINAWNDIWVERAGHLVHTDATFRDEAELVYFIKQIGRSLGQEIDEEARPILNARMSDSSRINAIMAAHSVRGPVMTIRPFPKVVFTMAQLVEMDAITEEIAELVDLVVRAHLNLIVAGGTSSGKTTLLRACCEYVPQSERCIGIEDTAENLMPRHPHFISLEAPKKKLPEGAMHVTMGSLIEESCRMRPDRQIIGEIRHPDAAVAFAEAINTGHSGVLTTTHANSAVDAFARIGGLYNKHFIAMTQAVIQQEIRRNVHVVIHASRELDKNTMIYDRRIREVLWLEEVISEDEEEVRHKPVRLIQFNRRERTYDRNDQAIVRFRESLFL